MGFDIIEINLVVVQIYKILRKKQFPRFQNCFLLAVQHNKLAQTTVRSRRIAKFYQIVATYANTVSASCSVARLGYNLQIM